MQMRPSSARATYGSPTAGFVRATIALAVAAMLAVALTTGQQVRAEPAAGADRQHIQEMIRAQIAAFQADDGETAFSYASPAIRALFGDADRFMAMVAQSYAPVYRPRSVIFGEQVARDDDRVLQPVYLVGPAGNSWIAAYFVGRQDDGSWRIEGVQMVRDRAGTSL